MPTGERGAKRDVAIGTRAADRDHLNRSTSVAGLTPTAAWSRRVRWVGGLIQASFAAFWLVRGSVVIGGRVAAAWRMS